MTSTDRIEKQTTLQAPIARVWRALSQAEQFGQWFGVKLDGGFAPGRKVAGQILHPGHEHVKFEIAIERMEAERLFSFRGSPDGTTSATTLAEFHLEEVPEGTRLTVIESGFDAMPAERREELLRGNAAGWEFQLENLRKFLGG